MAQVAKKPVQVFRVRGISASVWANQAKNDQGESTFYKVSLQRTYKENDQFKSTNSLGRDDLPLACLLLQRCWEFILDKEAKRNKEAE